jgi:maltose alpha-D-glucosyltransferase / alpha-amylase
MRIMGYWLELGVSGFRVDAAPFLIELKGIDSADTQDPYEYLNEFRAFLSWRRGDAVLIAEANVSPDKIDDYFGPAPKMHMLFNFLVNQHLFLALARQDRTPLVKALHMTPPIPPDAQWAHFLRNHDELDLGRLTDVQRRAVFEAFAPDDDMQLYGRGIRRRLAPMLDGDPDRIRLAHSLLLTLPGTPVIRYGQEIGMGEDLSLEERNAVRTVMQWSDGPNGGFSDAPPDRLARPAIASGPFAYDRINVEAQQRDPASLLAWIERAIQARKRCPELGRGGLRILETDQPAVLGHAATFDGGTVVAVHNLCDAPLTVRVDLSGIEGEELTDQLGEPSVRPLVDELELELERYGFRWYRVRQEAR